MQVLQKISKKDFMKLIMMNIHLQECLRLRPVSAITKEDVPVRVIKICIAGGIDKLRLEASFRAKRMIHIGFKKL
jgi:hypothetical protein